MIPDAILTQLAGYLESPSTISDHGKPCCRRGRAWLRGVDASNSYRDAHWHPPTWLRKEYEWGPVRWPIYWCSLPHMERLDCGALAGVAVELYRLRGVPVTSVQLALRYPDHAAEQWARMWEREGMSAGWINGAFCYHEACGVIDGQEVHVWDPTENRWIAPPSSSNDAFASVVALKVAERGAGKQAAVTWDGIRLRSGVWQSLVFDVEGRLTSRLLVPRKARDDGIGVTPLETRQCYPVGAPARADQSHPAKG